MLLNSLARSELGPVTYPITSPLFVTPKNNNLLANLWVINSEGAFFERSKNPENLTSGYLGYKINCVYGAGFKVPSSRIHKKSIFALKRSLFQSPAASFVISVIGKIFRTSKLPPKYTWF